MRRSRVLRLGSAGIVLGLVMISGAPVTTARDFESVEVKVIPARGAVSMVVGAGGNLAVSVGEDGTFLVDDQFAPLTEKILAAVHRLKEGPIRFVLNTHWHGDHTGGNENLGRSGAVIVAHGNVRRRMSVEQVQPLRGKTIPAAPHTALPVITFADSVSFHVNGEEVNVFHLAAAHTDGDAIVHFRGSDVLHAGDVFFNGSYPFIDLDSGGSVDGTIAAQEEILRRVGPATLIIPGHGPLSDAEGLRAAHDMLVVVRDLVRDALARGVAFEEVLAGEVITGLDTRWGGGFIDAERLLRIVQADLARQP